MKYSFRAALMALASLSLALQPALAEPKRAVVVSSGAIRALPAGDTVLTNPATSANASINLPHGVAPTAPVNGDCWTTTASAFCRINGTTVDLGAGGGGGGSGTVTSVAVAGGTTGLSTSGGPVTGSGTITLAGTLDLDNGGTGATTAAGARTALGLGTAALSASGDFQPLAAVLTGTTASFTTAQESKLAGVASGATANSADATLLARANHTGTQAVGTITGLGTLATQSGTFSGTSSGTNTGDQTSVVGITGSLAEFNTALTGADFATGGGTASGANTGDQDLSSYATTSAVASSLSSYATTSAVAGGYQPLDSDLTAIAALTTTAAGRALLDDADASAQRTTLGLGTLATQSGTFSGTSSGTNTGDQTSVTGNAGTATALATGRTLAITGDLAWTSPSFDGSGNVTAAGTIASSAVTLAKMADVATATVFYRKTAATGAPEVQTLATLKTDLGLTGTNSGDQTSVTGNAGTATALATGRTLAITGDLAWTSPSFDGTGNVTAAGTIATSAVTLAKMADVATATVFYRKTAATGAPEVQTLATLKTDLGLTGTNSGDQASIVGITGTTAQFNTALSDADFATGGGTATGANTGDQTITLTGNVTGSGTGSFAATIATSAVTLAKMADVATATVFYRKTAATGAPEVQTLATLKTDLGLTGTNSGDQTSVTGNAGTATALATGRTLAITGDLAWTSPSFDGSGNVTAAGTIATSAVTLAKMADVATASVFYRKTAATGAPEVQTLATLKTDLGLTGTNSGDQASIVGISGTTAQFNTALSDADFATGGGTATGANTGDQTITLTGNVTGSGTGSFAATIANSAVTLAKMADVATATVFYRKTAATGAPEVQTLATLKTDLVLVKADVGLGSVDNTADTAKPVSTAQQTALDLKANLASPTFTGTVLAAAQVNSGVNYVLQPTPTAKTATGTLTIAELLTGLITVTSATAVSLTLPTGTLTDAGVVASLAVDRAFDWGFINLGSSTGITTLVAGTGHTIVGLATTAINTSSRWRTRKTATNTFVTYRID